MNQEKIVQAIAAYLEKETTVKYGFLKLPERLEFNHSIQPGQAICQEIAIELAAAIAPYLEAGAGKTEPKDYPYSELFNHMYSEHGLTLTNTEMGDIIHIARK